MKKIVVFGCTGSVGIQVIELLKDRNDYQLVAVSGYNNLPLLSEIIKSFPSINKYFAIKKIEEVKAEYEDKILSLIKEGDYIVNAVSGFSGCEITIEALKANKKVYLANKESLVCSGDLIDQILKNNNNAEIFPLDSEHCAIYQLLKNNDKEVKKIVLTASGGPFRKISLLNTHDVKKEDVLRHPTWNMGQKITIDSATMFNKALEIIEAYYLFKTKEIDVLINPTSLIHSMVLYNDNSYAAQISAPDMKQVINYFLSECKKTEFANQKDLDFSSPINIELVKINEERFVPIKLAYDCLKSKNSKSVALNAANEACVDLFVKDKIKFHQITEIVNDYLNKCPNVELKSYQEIKDFHIMVVEEIMKIWET